MAKEILNDEQKDFLVYSYGRGTSQTDLAKYFNVSRKTVWRILNERGELTNSLSADTRKMLRMLQNHHITPQKLALMLQMRSVTDSQRAILDVAAGHQLGAQGLQQALAQPGDEHREHCPLSGSTVLQGLHLPHIQSGRCPSRQGRQPELKRNAMTIQIKTSHMSLYPTRSSLVEAAQEIEAKLEGSNEAVFPLLMMYHNTLLAQLDQQVAA